MASSSTSRVYTYIRPMANSPPVLAQFSNCLVSAFNTDQASNEARVQVELEGDKLILSPPSSSTSSSEEGSEDYLMKHFERCPARALSSQQRQDIPEKFKSRNVGSAVSILLESNDDRILLTRRPEHMRTFPNVWVPPGGSIEGSDRSLLEAGARELKEEVGIDILGHCSKPNDAEDLLISVTMQPEEVGAYAWLDRNSVSTAIESPPIEKDPRSSSTFTVHQLVKTETQQLRIETVEKPSSVLSYRYLEASDMAAERLSSGTIFALEEWFKLKQK